MAKNSAIDEAPMPKARWIRMPSNNPQSAHPTNEPRHQCNRLSLFSFTVESIIRSEPIVVVMGLES
jgi:hypothetical protein